MLFQTPRRDKRKEDGDATSAVGRQLGDRRSTSYVVELMSQNIVHVSIL